MRETPVHSLSLFAPIWATRARRLLLLLCAVVAAVTALAGSGGSDGSSPLGDDATFVEVSRLVQSAVSVPLPFLGVLLAADVRTLVMDPMLTSGGRRYVLWRRMASAGVSAILVGGFAVLASAVATAGSGGGWAAATEVVVGSLTVQLVAQFIGFGFGLLIGTKWLAMVVDAVLPVGLWAMVGAVGLGWAQRWLFPYDSVGDLISTDPSALDWAQEGVVVLLWVVGLTGLAWTRVVRLVARSPVPVRQNAERRNG